MSTVTAQRTVRRKGKGSEVRLVLQAKSLQSRGKFARSIVKVLPIRTLAGGLNKQKGRWIEAVPNVPVVQSLS